MPICIAERGNSLVQIVYESRAFTNSMIVMLVISLREAAKHARTSLSFPSSSSSFLNELNKASSFARANPLATSVLSVSRVNPLVVKCECAWQSLSAGTCYPANF